MRRFAAMVRHDLILQYRHYFYHVYAVISALYAVLLHLLSRAGRNRLLPILVFSDPAVLGFFFIGAIVFFEKDASNLAGLAATPLRPGEYLAAKALSLTVLSVAAAAAISLFALGLRFNMPLLVAAVALSGIFYVFVGYTVAAWEEDLSSYLLSSAPVLFVLGLPILPHIGFTRTPLYYLLPSMPALDLIAMAFAPWQGLAPILWRAGLLLLWIWAAFALALKFHRRLLAGSC